MSAIRCDYCHQPATWYAVADSPRSDLVVSRYVCRSELHLIRAREVLGPCSVTELNGERSGRTR